MTPELRAWAASLGVHGPFTVRPAPALPRIPLGLVDVALRLGLLPMLIPRQVHVLMKRMGIPPATARWTLARVRRRAAWQAAWERAAAGEEARGDELAAAGDQAAAYDAYLAAFGCLRMIGLADGYYFVVSPEGQRTAYRQRQRVYAKLLAVDQMPCGRVAVPHRGSTLAGLLHFPQPDTHGAPGLLMLHGLGGEKETMDWGGVFFRRAGFVTLALDLPAHGENAGGPRVQPGDESGFAAALDLLAARPEVDPGRLAILGGSFGGLWTLRTAAVDRRLKAVVALASLYQLDRLASSHLEHEIEMFAAVTGVTDVEEGRKLAQQLSAAGRVAQITCPLFIGHGTLDHWVPFAEVRHILAEARCPVTVHPFIGADHEVCEPAAEVAGPVIEWLQEVMASGDPDAQEPGGPGPHRQNVWRGMQKNDESEAIEL